jgi:hypothetical protein
MSSSLLYFNSYSKVIGDSVCNGVGACLIVSIIISKQAIPVHDEAATATTQKSLGVPSIAKGHIRPAMISDQSQKCKPILLSSEAMFCDAKSKKMTATPNKLI